MRFKSVILAAVLILVPLTGLASQTILVFGDSLSAAYGIPRETGWVNLLGQRLANENPVYRVINASVSGETTSGGLRRIAAALSEHQPTIVLIELGANDGLRGLQIDEIRNNLATMIELCHQSRAKVVLIGMRIPPNYGIQYTRNFSEMFSGLARQYKVKLVPFLLDGIAGNPDRVQPDGLHPIATAQPLILDNVWPALQPLLTR
jgi:acyl-CoA thioesterase-1